MPSHPGPGWRRGGASEGGEALVQARPEGPGEGPVGGGGRRFELPGLLGQRLVAERQQHTLEAVGQQAQ